MWARPFPALSTRVFSTFYGYSFHPILSWICSMQSWLTHCSQPQVEASVVDPWTRDGRWGVDRIVVTIFSGPGIPELPDLPVHRQLSLGPEKVDVDEEEEEEAAEEQIDVEQLKKVRGPQTRSDEWRWNIYPTVKVTKDTFTALTKIAKIQTHFVFCNSVMNKV